LSFRLVWLLVAIASVRIVSTYWVLNHTMDEPFFISCGLEWLTQRTYNYMPEQPPLSHATAAVGAWLAGARNVAQEDLLSKAPMILYNSPSYFRTLASARLGELPFFVLAALVVWFWARRLHGDLAALAAVLLFTTTPVVLGHAGLATTDIALCGTLVAALYAFIRWLDQPEPKQTILLALAVAAGILSKFTFFLFFPVSVFAILLLRTPSVDFASRKRSLALAVSICLLTVWAGYWFAITPVPTSEGPGGMISLLPGPPITFFKTLPTIWVPAGQLYEGIVAVREHNFVGHLSYLFGQVRTGGWWYFFPVVLAYKTPLPFLVLALLSCLWLARAPREHWIPLACACGILLSVMPARLNLGIRHILPIFPLMAIPAGLAAAQLIRSARAAPRILGGFLLIWHLAASISAHPNYIAYFNELAAGKPERIRVDSDLDWGQNFEQLGPLLRKRGITGPISLALWGPADTSRHGLADNVIASPWQPSTGWVAVSATERFLSGQKAPDGSGQRPWAWLDSYEPVDRLGAGVLLYVIPPAR
jgi:4-amino-4-deoxy-L-arabinose transferase-like glycosyltransferase